MSTTIGPQDPLARQVIEQQDNANLIVYPQSIADVDTGATSNSITITTSVNNQSGDIVTVYSTPGAVNVTAVDQVVNQYITSGSGVSAIEAGNNISITSSAGNGQGTVTINADLSAVNTVSTANTVINNAQPNITSVGTLVSLGVSNTIVAANIIANTGVFSGNGSGLTSLTGANVSGTVPLANAVSNASQPNITSLGSLTSLTVGNTNLSNSVVTLTNPTGSNLFPNTGFAYINQANSGDNRSLDFVRIYGTISNGIPVGNTGIAGQQNFRIFNSNTYPIV